MVVEGRPGGTRADVGLSTFEPSHPTGLPDLQIQVSRILGNGSAAVCDDTPPTAGGVPAIDPPTFEPTQEVKNAINDLGCRFKDGNGSPRGRGRDNACTISLEGAFGVVNPTSLVQFCGLVNAVVAFPEGDTLVTVRIRAVDGYVSEPARLILRVNSALESP